MIHYYNLCQLIDEVFAEHANKPALRYSDISYTFREISNWVDSLASLFLSRGLKRGDVVAIGHDKQPLSYAVMLAALRVGVAYVNIDVASPISRSDLILKTSKPKLLFYDNPSYKKQMSKLAEANSCELLLLDLASLHVVSKTGYQIQQQQSCQVDGSTIAYIMFTSGSTGKPKGVAVTHQNVLHFMKWGREHFNITGSDNFANLSPMYFDNSVFDFYVGLLSGASLTPIHRSLLSRPYELVSYVSKLVCSVWFSVPSALMYLMTMKAIPSDSLPSLRLIIFGGEGYPKVELKKLYDLFSKQALLVNVYGPTECTCICSAHTLSADDFQNLDGIPTLGYLNPNFDYIIRNDDNCEDVEGELCLIGPNVAAGYFNDPERTALAFGTINDQRRFMKPIYFTGDLVKEAGGQLHFVGRKDNQIKHLGYRIELEEIENALMTLPNVSRAAAIYHRAQSIHGKIVAFIACNNDEDEKQLLMKLRHLLPDYMLPSRLIVMPHLPINPNGKVDRQQLISLIN
jgi:D-alanine--poly(phosphoribitol) ligase subunit 1